MKKLCQFLFRLFLVFFLYYQINSNMAVAGKKNLIVSTHCDIEKRVSNWIDAGIVRHDEVFVIGEMFGCSEKFPTNPMFCILTDMSDLSQLASCTTYMKEAGPFDHVIAMDEYSQIISARIRDALNVPGMRLDEAVKFRDKVLMKDALKNSKVLYPKYFKPSDLKNNSSPLPFPLIAKPRSSAASRGIKILQDTSDLDNFLFSTEKGFLIDEQPLESYSEFKTIYEFEQFIEGKIFHLDGGVQNGEIVFFYPSAYIGNGLTFLQGAPYGSLMVSDPEEIKRWKSFAQSIHETMKFPDGVFHLEAILTGDNQRYFLEMGIRPGGGFIVSLLEEHLGINIEHLHIILQVQKSIDLKIGNSHKVGGVLSFPKSLTEKNLLVKEVHLPKNLSKLKTLTRVSNIPSSNDSAYGYFSYFDTLGNFFFTSSKSASIERDIDAVINAYIVKTYQP